MRAQEALNLSLKELETCYIDKVMTRIQIHINIGRVDAYLSDSDLPTDTIQKDLLEAHLIKEGYTIDRKSTFGDWVISWKSIPKTNINLEL